MKNNNFFRSMRSAISGLLFTFRTERNFKIQIIVALAAIIMALVLSLSAIKLAILFVIIGVVLAAEIFNTVIEHLIDSTSKQYIEKYGKVKDISAAAVLIVCIVAAVIGVFIFLL